MTMLAKLTILTLKDIAARERLIACVDWVSQNNLHIQQGMLKT